MIRLDSDNGPADTLFLLYDAHWIAHYQLTDVYVYRGEHNSSNPQPCADHKHTNGWSRIIDDIVIVWITRF